MKSKTKLGILVLLNQILKWLTIIFFIAIPIYYYLFLFTRYCFNYGDCLIPIFIICLLFYVSFRFVFGRDISKITRELSNSNFSHDANYIQKQSSNLLTRVADWKLGKSSKVYDNSLTTDLVKEKMPVENNSIDRKPILILPCLAAFLIIVFMGWFHNESKLIKYYFHGQIQGQGIYVKRNDVAVLQSYLDYIKTAEATQYKLSVKRIINISPLYEKSGDLFYRGNGVKQNYSKAFHFYVKALKKGNYSVLSHITHMCSDGSNISYKDVLNAYTYLFKLKRKGLLNKKYFSDFQKISHNVACFDSLGPSTKVNISEKSMKTPYYAPLITMLSPNNKHVAFLRTINHKYVALVDGKASKKYDEIDDLTFSPDSKHFAFIAGFANKSFVVLDGKEEAKYKQISYLTFSPDSKHLAYSATNSADKSCVLLDGKKGKEYDNIGDIIFSPDSKHMAYIAKAGNKGFIVLDEKESKKYDKKMCHLNDPVFSPDSKHIAYVVDKAGYKSLVMLDGEELKAYNDVNGITSLMFSPDSKRLAYVIDLNGKLFVVVDGKAGKGYYSSDKGSINPVFSPDSKHFLYLADTEANLVIVVDGKEIKKYPKCIRYIFPVFSPDSKHIAYGIYNGKKKCFVVIDGRERRGYYSLGKHIVFSPDSKHVAYWAEVRLLHYVLIIDGNKVGKQYFSSCGSPVFSPDSKHIAYWAEDYNGDYVVVIDGKERGKYDHLIEDSKIIFDSSNCLHFVAGKDDGFCFVTMKLKNS